jgi:large subunit ribosomal protein L10
MTSHNRAWKEAKKEEITKLAKDYPFVAVVTLNELPANIVSVLRKKLKGDAKIVVAKTRVIQMAFAESGIDTSKIDNLVKESIAIIFSNKNPFELFSFVKKNKGDTTAKVGDIAEVDILVQAGDTGLPPGPALSTLKGAGLKVQVAGPTISITKDKIVTKKGEEVSPDVADVLGKLNMKPMKVGMSILGVLDKADNECYLAAALDVDEEELFDKFVMAYQNALNLSVNAAYYNDDSTEIILIKAQREANAVNDETGTAQETKEEPATEEKAEEAPKTEEPVAEVKADAEPVAEVKEEPVAEVKEEPVAEKASEVPAQEKEDVAEQATNDISENNTEKKEENNN